MTMVVKSDGPKIKIVGAVVQAIKLLHAIGNTHRPKGVSALARDAGINPSTAFNILRTLTLHQLVAFDEPSKTYTLGHGLYGLAKGVLDRSLPELLKPEMQRIATETASLVGLWEVSGDRFILLDRTVANLPMRLDMEPGQRLPLVLGAVGRAVAASLRLPDKELRARFKQLRWNGVITVAQYIGEVRETQALGYSVDRGTLYPGVYSIGVVVTNVAAVPIYGLTASALAGTMNEARVSEIGRKLAEVAKTFSATPPQA